MARSKVMKQRSLIRATLILALSLLLIGCEYLPFSQGELQGTVAAIPADWQGIADKDIIQFETEGDTPYSVNLWVVEIDDHLHVFAGDNVATWVDHILNRSALVRLAADGTIYELKASRITDAEYFERFARAWEAKYGNRPRNENVDETYLFKLSPR